MKKIFNFIRIDEYVLVLFVFMLIVIDMLLATNTKEISLLGYFTTEKNNLLGVVYFFYPITSFLLFIILLRCISEIKRRLDLRYFRKNIGEYPDLITNETNLRNLFVIIIRKFVGIFIFFFYFCVTLGIYNQRLNARTINIKLIEIDKALFFGNYPFIWFQEAGNLFRNFDKIIVYSFSSLAVCLSLGIIAVMIFGNRKVFSRYLLSIFIVSMLAMMLWFIFPSNSPNNAFISNKNNREKISADLREKIDLYKPLHDTKKYLSDISKEQKDNPPITTMPSMHIAYALILVYMIWSLNKKAGIALAIWAFFSSVGTVYLAQHYFLDVLVSIPLTIISIKLSRKLIDLEDSYYKVNKWDKQEEKMKDAIKKDTKQAFGAYLFAYSFLNHQLKYKKNKNKS
jgi:membrane-associated phospholipid phosphatase